MAILKQYDDPDTGASYPVAYWRLLGWTQRPGAQTADVVVQAFVDATAAGGARTPLKQASLAMGPAGYAAVFAPTASVADVPSRVYAWLKLRPELAGGVDA